MVCTELCASLFCPFAARRPVLSSILQDSFKRPSRGASKVAAFGVMASDGVESKMTGANLRQGAVREHGAEKATQLNEWSGDRKWLDGADGKDAVQVKRV